jgi:purine-binding chemotaxis protein CheW
MELACFEVCGQVLGIDVKQIREVVRSQPLTPLPKSPGLIEGLMDLRGAVVPVVDLGRALDLGPVAVEPGARIVLVEVDRLLLGLRVDAATDVIALDDGRIESAPSSVGSDAIRAVVPREQAPPVLVLCLEPLLAALGESQRPVAELVP